MNSSSLPRQTLFIVPPIPRELVAKKQQPPADQEGPAMEEASAQMFASPLLRACRARFLQMFAIAHVRRSAREQAWPYHHSRKHSPSSRELFEQGG